MNGMQAATIAGAFVFGMVLALLGSIKLTLAKRLAIGEIRMGGLLSALNFALMPMMLVSGVLIDMLGVRLMLILGSLLTAGTVYCLSLRPKYWWAILCSWELAWEAPVSVPPAWYSCRTRSLPNTVRRRLTSAASSTGSAR